jgi:tetratricopeptide (TPR) repeat protein
MLLFPSVIGSLYALELTVMPANTVHVPLRTSSFLSSQEGWFKSQTDFRDIKRLFELATQNLQDGKYNQAIEIYTRILNIDPSIHEAYTNRGIAKYHLDLFQLAIQDFNMALRINGSDFWALAYRGLSYRELGNLQQAVSDLSRAIQVQPSEAFVYYERALTKALMNSYQDAIADLTKAINMNPKNLDFYLLRAGLYRESGNCPSALQDYNIILRLDSQNSFAYLGRGICAIASKPDLAIKDFNSALKYSPSLVTVYKYRGVAYMLVDQLAQGCADLSKAIKVDPGFSNPNPAPMYREFLKAYNSNCGVPRR